MALFNKKGEVEVDFLTWLIIAVVVGVVAAIGIFILGGKWSSALDFIRNAFGFS